MYSEKGHPHSEIIQLYFFLIFDGIYFNIYHFKPWESPIMWGMNWISPSPPPILSKIYWKLTLLDHTLPPKSILGVHRLALPTAKYCLWSSPAGLLATLKQPGMTTPPDLSTVFPWPEASDPRYTHSYFSHLLLIKNLHLKEVFLWLSYLKYSTSLL